MVGGAGSGNEPGGAPGGGHGTGSGDNGGRGGGRGPGNLGIRMAFLRVDVIRHDSQRAAQSVAELPAAAVAIIRRLGEHSREDRIER